MLRLEKLICNVCVLDLHAHTSSASAQRYAVGTQHVFELPLADITFHTCCKHSGWCGRLPRCYTKFPYTELTFQRAM
jgi:hypothetical protein